MSIGTRLKSLRKKSGLNQTELGEIVGLTYSAISAMESDKCNLTSDVIIKLSSFFGVSADYLLTGVETERTISENEQEILEVLREDIALKNAVMNAANLKKKAISYLGNYKQPEQNAAIS
jgi:transcriptional regulator with XRE-family HTH domain